MTGRLEQSNQDFFQLVPNIQAGAAAICFGDGTDVQISAGVPTATFGKVPPHTNAFAVVFEHPGIVPFLQLGVFLDRLGRR